MSRDEPGLENKRRKIGEHQVPELPLLDLQAAFQGHRVPEIVVADERDPVDAVVEVDEEPQVPQAPQTDELAAVSGGRDAFNKGLRPDEIFFLLSGEECRHYLSEWRMNAEKNEGRPSHLEVELGYSLAHLAAQFGDVAVLQYINTMKREMLHEKTGADETLAHLAAEFGHVDVLRYLSEIGASEQFSEKTDEDGLTPARLAVESGHVEVLRYFSEIDISLLTKETTHEDGSLLDHAQACEQISCVEFLSPDSRLRDHMVPG